MVDRHAAKLTPINVRSLGETDLIELSFYVRLKHKDRGDELIKELNRTPGVQYVNLFFDEEQIQLTMVRGRRLLRIPGSKKSCRPATSKLASA